MFYTMEERKLKIGVIAKFYYNDYCMSSNIKCPKCGESFLISESISNEELRKAANIDIEKELNEKLKNEIARIEEEQKRTSL